MTQRRGRSIAAYTRPFGRVETACAKADPAIAGPNPIPTEAATVTPARVPARGIGAAVALQPAVTERAHQRPRHDEGPGLGAAIGATVGPYPTEVRRKAAVINAAAAFAVAAVIPVVAIEEMVRPCRILADLTPLPQVAVDARQLQVAEAGVAAARTGLLDEATTKATPPPAGQGTMGMPNTVVRPGAGPGRLTNT